MFKYALVKPPNKRIKAGISRANLGSPIYIAALKQHREYVEALSGCGLQVKILPPDDN